MSDHRDRPENFIGLQSVCGQESLASFAESGENAARGYATAQAYDKVSPQTRQHGKKIKMARKYLFGAAIAVGAVLLVPGVAAALGRAARPVVRAALKTGTVAYTEFRHAGAEVYEHMEDLAAELRAEMQQAAADEDPITATETAKGATDARRGERA